MRDNTATRLLLTAAVLLARWGAGAETIDLATVAPWTLTGWDSSNARTAQHSPSISHSHYLFIIFRCNMSLAQ